jgi:hypothetical protein
MRIVARNWFCEDKNENPGPIKNNPFYLPTDYQPLRMRSCMELVYELIKRELEPN